jgi:hypothetical protein
MLIVVTKTAKSKPLAISLTPTDNNTPSSSMPGHARTSAVAGAGKTTAMVQHIEWVTPIAYLARPPSNKVTYGLERGQTAQAASLSV